jgi:hypothetical protein
LEPQAERFGEQLRAPAVGMPGNEDPTAGWRWPITHCALRFLKSPAGRSRIDPVLSDSVRAA